MTLSPYKVNVNIKSLKNALLLNHICSNSFFYYCGSDYGYLNKAIKYSKTKIYKKRTDSLFENKVNNKLTLIKASEHARNFVFILTSVASVFAPIDKDTFIVFT